MLLPLDLCLCVLTIALLPGVAGSGAMASDKRTRVPLMFLVFLLPQVQALPPASCQVQNPLFDTASDKVKEDVGLFGLTNA